MAAGLASHARAYTGTVQEHIASEEFKRAHYVRFPDLDSESQLDFNAGFFRPLKEYRGDAESHKWRVDFLKKAGYPLGPVESLELTWDAPLPANSTAAQVPRTADIDVTIRVEDAQIETTARLRLRGGAAQWLLALPATADVVTERLAPTGVAESTTV